MDGVACNITQIVNQSIKKKSLRKVNFHIHEQISNQEIKKLSFKNLQSLYIQKIQTNPY